MALAIKMVCIKRARHGWMELIVAENEKVIVNLDFLRAVCDPALMTIIEGLRPEESVSVAMRLASVNAVEPPRLGWRYGA